jgi:urea transport system substrate-binding protein
MGVVYKAHHVALDRIVALKTIPGTPLAGPNTLARFDVEARAVARLRHPHIVQIHEVGSHDGCPFFALEYMDGGNLSRFLDDKPLEPRRAARVAAILARAAHHAHSRGIIHRDLKPSNVMMDRNESGPDLDSVKIGDFGLARMLEASPGEGENRIDAAKLTLPGMTLGTPSYMAPEQAQAQGQGATIGPATDVYGLGAILYEMLCGRPPFQADSDWMTMHQVVHSTPPPVHDWQPKCPPALEAVCLRCLNKDPAERYPSAEALADDLERFLDGRPVRTPLTVSGLYSRRAWLAGTALVTVAAFGSAAALRSARGPASIRVGVLQSQTEFMGEAGQAVIDATLAALDEVNQAGGVLGRAVEPIVADGQSDEVVFAREARRLLGVERVRVLFGCLTSTHRRAVEPLVAEHNGLLVYPGESEGLDLSPEVICLGPLPNQHVLPAVRWFREALQKRRYFLVGSDAVYPRAVEAILGDAAPALGIELIGASYVAAGDVVGWVIDAVREIEARRPDAIISLIQGKANLAFIHRLRARGITPVRIPTLSCTFTEHDLRNILREMAGDYLCGHYYQSLPTLLNSRFLARLARDPRIGDNPVVSDAMVAAYTGVHLWARAVERGGERALDDLSAVRKAITSVTLSGPGGPVKIDPAVQCDAKYARVAQVGTERRIEVVWSSPAPIPPIAYPATRTRDRWDDLIRKLFERWKGHWSSRAYFTTL